MATSQSGAEPIAPLPPADLGQTNILDGDGGPGALLEIISFSYDSDRLIGADGHSVAGANQQQIEGVIVHPVWVSNTSWLSAHLGIEVLLPDTHLRDDFAAGGSGSDSPLGDTTVAPFLQWTPKTTDTGAVSARLGFQIVVPSGHYSEASRTSASAMAAGNCRLILR